ncbi:MAG: OmpA family protein [Alphaproteobacteria bacterium]|nr:OmpA family protein [Alphaproteobacteria bacterium]
MIKFEFSIFLIVCTVFGWGFAAALNTSAFAKEPKPIQVPGDIEKPGSDPWQVPREFQKPGEFQVPGDIQKAKAVDGCSVTLTAYSDALFDFDKRTLTPAAGKTLKDVADTIEAETNLKRLRVRGHTDSKGTDAYNDRLSQARAATVQEWLAKRLSNPVAMSSEAVGEREPVKPNANADGSDNPGGRAFNRHVELVLELCK